MDANIWGERWSSNESVLAREWMKACVKKQSLVVLAADRYDMAGLNQLLELVSPYVVALKTHVDLVTDWTPVAWDEFCDKAKDAGMLIFEDRKFADIGKISRDQMGGVHNISNWGDIVTAHLISGPDIIDGLQEAWSNAGRVGGVLLLAQMSSRGNLLQGDYSNKVVEVGSAHEGVFGFIGNGSNAEEIARLREKVGVEKMIWTPGVNLNVGDGEMGQRYGHPREAVLAGSDGIIVGSGIHKSEDPGAAASAYAQASWDALLERKK